MVRIIKGLRARKSSTARTNANLLKRNNERVFSVKQVKGTNVGGVKSFNITFKKKKKR